MSWEGGLSLGEIMEELKKHDAEKVLNIGLYNPASYRGYYECLMFTPKDGSTVGESLATCECANGITFMGYKGGEFTMTADTECFFAEYSYTGIPITKLVLHGILNNLYTYEEFMQLMY